MPKSPFEVLGVSENVTQNELYDAYKSLRNFYSDKRFAPGEEGAEACEKLDAIEAAYREADQILQTRFYITNFDNAFKGVEDRIRSGKLEEAQSELDRIPERNAEWHFMQSMIFYRKRWYNESREQLKIAMEMEPGNARYKESFENLNAKTTAHSGPSQGRNSFYNGENNDSRAYRNSNVDRDGGRVGGCSVCDCCSSLICADCCCECMGGDLIACC